MLIYAVCQRMKPNYMQQMNCTLSSLLLHVFMCPVFFASFFFSCYVKFLINNLRTIVTHHDDIFLMPLDIIEVGSITRSKEHGL